MQGLYIGADELMGFGQGREEDEKEYDTGENKSRGCLDGRVQ